MNPRGRHLRLLTLGALGVVYGDIGTSPLYALREAFTPHHGLDPSSSNVLGVLSLIIWALIAVISIKYLAFVMRADNHGEGGIMALTSLVTPLHVRRGGARWLLILLGLFGAALLYGDGMITPAISVLSAVEGLHVATPRLEPYVIPITVGILVLLFSTQRLGTNRVGRMFGPVMVLWFATLAILGLVQIVREPSVLAAINPLYGLRFFVEHGVRALLVLGSVFLVVTGGEALYTDMGHFGKRPIRVAWFGLVLPALLLNYWGQGALILSQPSAITNPFFSLVPTWLLLPVVLLATAATVIASQALISGTFSLTMQAMQVGYIPRLDVKHTSASTFGQVYIPAINWVLMVACIGLVLSFRSSSNLAAAYGVGVSTDMVITTILFFVVAREVWRWPTLVAGLLTGFFLIVDLAFFGANIVKIPQGGWFPLVVALVVFTVLTTWKRGRVILSERLDEQVKPLTAFLKSVAADPPSRVPGTAIFMFRSPVGTPYSLAQNFKAYHVLHERVILLAVRTEDRPHVKLASRIECRALGNGFYQVVLHYGFMEHPNVAGALRNLTLDGEKFDTREVTYFLGRETLKATKRRGMAIWREKLFVLMSKNAASASSYYRLPPAQVVEIGTQVEL